MIKRFIICFLFASLIITPAKAQDATDKYILTPKEKPTPQINGPEVFGVRPNHPVLFTVPVTGTRPIAFTAKGLPAGLILDPKNGRLSGSIVKKGTYKVVITAKNSLGTSSRQLDIIVGETIALTPPMGWNSWNIYADKPTQALILANAKAMANSGLINHGWNYLNIDDAWQGKRGGEYKAILPDTVTFPDMQGLIKEIHQLGLKA